MATGTTVTACAASPPHPRSPANVPTDAPLDPSYVLVPSPKEDEGLLGRVLLDTPQPNGQPLDQTTRPNECAEYLTRKADEPMAATFEDSRELGAGDKSKPALHAFGFEDDAAKAATFFHYKLEVARRVSLVPTAEYAACCKTKGSCGYGFVSALVYGDGQYAAAADDPSGGGVPLPTSDGGYVRSKVLRERKVHGYVAALVTATGEPKPPALDPLGERPTQAAEEGDLPASMRDTYDANKLSIVDPKDELHYTIRDGQGYAITENEFVRRYRVVLGDELDEYERNHALGPRVAWTTGLVAGLGVAFTGLVVSVSDQQGQCTGGMATSTTSTGAPNCGLGSQGIAGAVVAGVGFVGATVSGIGLALSLGRGTYDGPPGEHLLARSDAARYIARYNRALLRKNVHDAQELSQDMTPLRPLRESARGTVTIAPVVSPLFTGIVGQF